MDSLTAFPLDGATALFAKGTRHARAEQERGIGRIDDGAGAAFGDVTLGGFQGLSLICICIFQRRGRSVLKDGQEFRNAQQQHMGFIF